VTDGSNRGVTHGGGWNLSKARKPEGKELFLQNGGGVKGDDTVPQEGKWVVGAQKRTRGQGKRKTAWERPGEGPRNRTWLKGTQGGKSYEVKQKTELGKKCSGWVFLWNARKTGRNQKSAFSINRWV